jgi:probable rRNA maturation factor
VICAPVVISEANEQNKEIRFHFAHLVVHGVLHLLGYDHEEAQAAHAMESIEAIILNELGFANPYGEEITHE